MELNPASLTNKYILLSKQPDGGNDYTPRPGYYLIIAYKSEKAKNGKEYTTALALYSDAQTFHQVLMVSIYLHQLKNNASKGPKSLHFDALVNNIIEVKEVNLKLESYKFYQIIWDFVGNGEEVIEHFRLVEKQQYRILEEIAFEDWLEEEHEQLYFDELMKEEFKLKQPSKDWLDEELEQLYIDQLVLKEIDKSNSDDELYDLYINNEDAGFLDGLLLDSQNDSILDEDGMQYDQDQQAGVDDNNVNDEDLVD